MLVLMYSCILEIHCLLVPPQSGISKLQIRSATWRAAVSTPKVLLPTAESGLKAIAGMSAAIVPVLNVYTAGRVVDCQSNCVLQ